MTPRDSTFAEAPDASVVAGLLHAEELVDRYRDADTHAFLAGMIRDEFPGRLALVSSFGSEAAVLLHLVASVDPTTPVIFLDTGKLFGETLRYRDKLAAELGLRDLRSITPDPERIEALDPDGVLWYGNPNMCCHIRKVEPMNRALEGFDAWITGRKRFQGGKRTALPRLEVNKADGRIKINPLADWRKENLDAYFERHALPRHPLEADGFLSIGCMACTDRVAPGEDVRAGRWRGQEKTECGIHLPLGKWKINGID
jgi:phosphoadenosine phosphosulfate reductase